MEEMFWGVAESFISGGRAEEGTMMGFACLRTRGDSKAPGGFVATVDHDGRLIVKLPADRVAELVESGEADNFAPASKVFREWAAFSPDLADGVSKQALSKLLEESLAFVGGT